MANKFQMPVKAIKEKAVDAKDSAVEYAGEIFDGIKKARLEKDQKELRPIFKDELCSVEFHMPGMMRIEDPDKKRMASKACEGSIGYWDNVNELDVINIYPSDVKQLGLTLLPETEKTVFLADPSREDRFISVDTYFDFVRKARVQELVRIADDLGATYVSIEYLNSEKKKEKEDSGVALEAGGGEKKRKTKDHDASDTRYKAGVKGETGSSHSNFYETAVKTEYTWEARDPVVPELHYFQNDEDIQDLIRMRMDGKIKNHTYLASCSKSIGIKTSEAAKMDGALRQMKCKAQVSVSMEMADESRVSLKYEVRF